VTGSGLPQLSDHAVAVVPDLRVGEAVHLEAGRFQRRRLGIIRTLVDEAAVMSFTVDLDDQPVLAIEEVDAAEPLRAPDVDLPNHRV
jgi:hypothetical protein